jgi:hypothetical protein
MAGPFESVTRVAIEELIQAHAQPSKFGFILTPDAYRELTNDLFDLLVTSRSLKTAGDRFMQGQAGGNAAPARVPTLKRPLR